MKNVTHKKNPISETFPTTSLTLFEHQITLECKGVRCFGYRIPKYENSRSDLTSSLADFVSAGVAILEYDQWRTFRAVRKLVSNVVVNRGNRPTRHNPTRHWKTCHKTTEHRGLLDLGHFVIGTLGTLVARSSVLWKEHSQPGFTVIPCFFTNKITVDLI